MKVAEASRMVATVVGVAGAVCIAAAETRWLGVSLVAMAIVHLLRIGPTPTNS